MLYSIFFGLQLRDDFFFHRPFLLLNIFVYVYSLQEQLSPKVDRLYV